jgi:hypothetical protein
MADAVRFQQSIEFQPSLDFAKEASPVSAMTAAPSMSRFDLVVAGVDVPQGVICEIDVPLGRSALQHQPSTLWACLRIQADTCRQLALTERNRLFWLRLADEWAELAITAEPQEALPKVSA